MNQASRMMSRGIAGRLHCSADAAAELWRCNAMPGTPRSPAPGDYGGPQKFRVIERGEMLIKCVAS